MYTRLWNKYLPIIKILLKRALISEQTLEMNVTDFERAGVARKAGYKFLIRFSNGKVDNVISSSVLAKELSVLLLEDKVVNNLLAQNDYHISMNSKFQLNMLYIPKESLQDEPAIAGEAVATGG